MTKNKKIFGGILLLVGGYLLYRFLRKPQPTIGNSTDAAQTKKKDSSQDTSGSRYVFPLKKGSRGSMVTRLQEALGGKAALPKFGVDGQFGSETEAAVQKALGKNKIDSFEEILKIANRNNLAYDSKTGKFFKPQGGVTSKISDILR